ncbi:MAG: hypothetical protein PHU46_00395 [Rhodocyclaceae bacterium]|nr:hypothetical protein [Rhodocyclaceae bacterium]
MITIGIFEAEAAPATGLTLATRDKNLRQATIESGVGVWQA